MGLFLRMKVVKLSTQNKKEHESCLNETYLEVCILPEVRPVIVIFRGNVYLDVVIQNVRLHCLLLPLRQRLVSFPFERGLKIFAKL